MLPRRRRAIMVAGAALGREERGVTRVIKIVAKMLVREDRVEDFKQAARELVEKSRQDTGNVYYTLNVSEENPRLLAFIECWRDWDAINAHGETAHFTSILPRIADMCEKALPVERCQRMSPDFLSKQKSVPPSPVRQTLK